MKDPGSAYWAVVRQIGIVNTSLLVVFIVLKLVGVIAWSWLWVLAPFWIPASLSALCILVVIALVLSGKVTH